MGKYKDLDEIVSVIEANGGFFSFQMRDVRDVFDFKKLAKLKVASIATGLEERGVGYSPNPLPHNQELWVWLYKEDHPIAGILEDIRNPSPEAHGRLKKRFSKDSEELLNKILVLIREHGPATGTDRRGKAAS